MPSTPRSNSGTPRSNRNSPKRGTPGERIRLTPESLLKNNIRIDCTPDKSTLPTCAEELYSALLEPFSGLIPLTKLEDLHCSWKVPDDAVEGTFPVDGLRMKKERRFDDALEIKKECEGLKERRARDEDPWNKLWSDIFKKQLDLVRTDHELAGSHPVFSQVCDMLFSRAKEISSTGESQLSFPKPDISLVFTTVCGNTADKDNVCFSRKILDDLQANGLISSPFKEKHQVCFPWGIYEGKKPKDDPDALDVYGGSKIKINTEPECQAANAAVKCIKMLERLKKVPGSSAILLKVGADYLPPIPCITCFGPEWKLWICYKSNDIESQPAYKLDKVFDGNMDDFWSCLQLIYIVERLKDWALESFKPWIHKHLEPWIKYSQGLKRESMLLNRLKLIDFESIPEIEQVFGVKRNVPYNPEGGNVLYHIKWKDCEARCEYIKKYPEKYHVVNTPNTEPIPLEGQWLFNFKKGWVNEKFLSERELTDACIMAKSLVII